MFLHTFETSVWTFPLSMALMSGLMSGYNLALSSLPPAGRACLLLYSMTWTCADLLGKSLAYIYRIFCIINESNLVSPVDYGGRIWGGGVRQSRLGGIFLLFCLSLLPSCLPLKLIPPSVLSSKLQSAWNEVRLIGQEPFCEGFFFFGYLRIVELVLGSLTSAGRIRKPFTKQLETSCRQFSTATINQMLFLILKALF